MFDECPWCGAPPQERCIGPDRPEQQGSAPIPTCDFCRSPLTFPHYKIMMRNKTSLDRFVVAVLVAGFLAGVITTVVLSRF